MVVRLLAWLAQGRRSYGGNAAFSVERERVAGPARLHAAGSHLTRDAERVRGSGTVVLDVDGAATTARGEVLAEVYTLEALLDPLLQTGRDRLRNRAGGHGERAEDRRDVCIRRDDRELKRAVTLAYDGPNAEAVVALSRLGDREAREFIVAIS